jgi:hypothetical protein
MNQLKLRLINIKIIEITASLYVHVNSFINFIPKYIVYV